MGIEDIITEAMNEKLKEYIGKTVTFSFVDEWGLLQKVGITESSGQIDLKVESIQFIEDDGAMWIKVNENYEFQATSGCLVMEVKE